MTLWDRLAAFEEGLYESLPESQWEDYQMVLDSWMALQMERPALRNSVTATLVQPSDFQDLLDPLLLLDSHVTPALPTQQPTDTDQQSMHDRDWLLNACADHIARFMPDAGLEAKQLTQDIFDLLRSKRNDEDIQNALVDFLGFGNLALVGDLIQYRRDIVQSVMDNAIALKMAQEAPLLSVASQEALGLKRPAYGAQVTVVSESEKLLAKQQRKLQKKQAKWMEDGGREDIEDMSSASLLELDGDYLRSIREQQLLSNMSAPPLADSRVSSETIKYPNVYQSGSGGGSVMSLFGTRYTLPARSERTDNKDYEEICIPIKEVPPNPATNKRRPISEFNDFAKRAFKGYDSLNRVQSIVFPIAYESNENMLVCAPTGAGKTDIAMLTVLRCIEQHMDEIGRIAKSDFKIVYIAPMKALAAEIARKFSKRLESLGISVRELTGDMQLTKTEISATQMLIVTPEKFDVVGRKSMGDTELMQKVRLLIIDEVHLLNEDRGSVIETIVARTQRLVESSQTMIRIVGLSATLPNYIDVAFFLGVNPYQGLFYFDGSFRPVPLEQHFVGVKGKAGSIVLRTKMNQVCYQKIVPVILEKRQAMVFVHSRKETATTALALRDEAMECGQLDLFNVSDDPQYGLFVKEVQKSKNKQLKELFEFGMGIHHAGMTRPDRLLTERLFEKGLIRVLCCTSTLAWGVNLPAFCVVIKGTQVYDATKGAFVDLSILDVLQIFGRAGRPQYEDKGVGYILTSHDKLAHYISAVTHQFPIESTFSSNMADNLNAEISLGTVTNMEEAIRWLSYTYMYVRMKKNPFHYGLTWKEIGDDSTLVQRRRDLIKLAAKVLHKAQMIVFDEKTGYLTPKNLGRIASSFYIRTQSIEIFNTMMRPRMTEADVLSMLSMSVEFENLKVREEEVTELKKLEKLGCACDVKGGIDTHYGKANILLQAFISRHHVEDFALTSDTYYVSQNAARILRGLFEIAMSRNWGPATSVILSLCKSVDKRLWSFDPPLMQFDLPVDISLKLESLPSQMSIEHIREMDDAEVGRLIRNQKMGSQLFKYANNFPLLALEAEVAPITRSVLRVNLTISADFNWNDRVHGYAEPFWIWVEDADNVDILYSEYFIMTKKQLMQPQEIQFTIPLLRTESTVDELPPQIFIRAISDRWIGSETVLPVSFKHLILPEMDRSEYTDLLDLQPLPISALKDALLEEICRKRFEYFNPIQTQVFHTLYHTKYNALIGAPTGSGKTVVAELAMWAAFRDRPQSKVVYIAPLKALVKERMSDWQKRLMGPMGRNIVELTGDVTPDMRTIKNADVIITTPEKWDGISRSWKSRDYVKSVSLVIIDEIHLLGNDRGPILEVIVSRMNYVATQTGSQVRFLGLSTALANARDLGDWLGIGAIGLFNFRHSVRPVPLEIYIDGFPGKHYCPRMMSMNKPAYKAIVTHAPDKPVIIFVSSRRQTRLTAQDLISLCANDDNPRRFTKIDEEHLYTLLGQIKDPALMHALGFGIGLHHAGLVEKDRQLVEELFVNGKIQILVATSTLAWGVNYPAHLVIIKGTEYFDAKKKGYVDYPITDVLQMMGRAGRIQFSDSGVAQIFVQDTKKDFYKKFLYEPFPVESHLHKCLHDHLNAEIVSGSVKNKPDAVDYLTWTYFYRRLMMNPAYYGAEDANPVNINLFLSQLIEDTLHDLTAAFCMEIEADFDISPTGYSKIASYYYLNYRTIRVFKEGLSKPVQLAGNLEDGQAKNKSFASLLRVLSDAHEYDELPVRHNEDLMNKALEKSLPLTLAESAHISGSKHTEYDDPHCKAFLLLQVHLDRLEPLPCSDYVTDTNSVLDQSIRILQAMVDFCVLQKSLSTSLGVMNLMQCIKQARWSTDSTLLCLPHVTQDMVASIRYQGSPVLSLSHLAGLSKSQVESAFSRVPQLRRRDRDEIIRVVQGLPVYHMTVSLSGVSKKDGIWTLEGSQKYDVTVDLKRVGPYPNDFKIYAPKFNKAQFEGWWIVFGDEAKDELLELKRVSPSSSDRRNRPHDMSTTFKFVTPADSGHHQFKIFLVSDGYLGLDQEADIRCVI